MKRLSLFVAGICLLVLRVSASRAAENATRSSSIDLAASTSANLTPYEPSGWSDKIVVSKGAGTSIDSSSLSPTDTLYVDWAVVNNGGAATGARFTTELYVDGVLRSSWYTDPPLSPGYYSYVQDYSIGSLSVGTHSIRIKTDSTNTVAEGDETDNEYTKNIAVSGASLCVADSHTLCLSGGRFQVQAAFQTSTIPAGVGAAVPLTGDTGYFWFFSDSNVELVVKVLDGRPFNSSFWVFYGALSDVAYTLTVTDTTTRAVRTYVNPAGHLASVADTAAFPGAVGSDRFTIERIGEAEAPLSTWMAAAPASTSPNVSPYQPSGWSDKIVVSKVPGTSVDSGSLSPTDNLYVDWAVVNNGGAATGARFTTELYVDGVLRSSWNTDPPLNANYYAYVQDYSIGSLSAGTHAIRIKTDSTNTVAESDETDNEYTKHIAVGGASLCVADSRTLCLSGGRFQVQAAFQTSTIPAGVGAAVPLTGDTGYFWFFSDSNVELVVKVLDARSINNDFWIFYGALSDVAYTITVTDTMTGAVKTYSNQQGHLASVADTAAFPASSGIPRAHLEIDHTSIGDLVLTLGVGDPASPSCKIPVANRTGGADANLVRDVDLTPCASALPPSASSRWFLTAQDAASGNVGQIRLFQIMTGGQIFAATDVPAAIQDLQTTRSFIPSTGGPPPPPPGTNHAPTLSRVDATRISHSFGRDDALRAEGVAGRPGFAAMQPLVAPRVITLDDNHDGQPDTASPIVVAAAGLPSCCTLLVAEGAADPDGDALAFHWQGVTGTFYSTGTDGSGGLAFGQKITDVTVYNRNSVFYELPSIGNVILEHDLMGGLTNPGASVTDVRSVPSQSLSSPARFAALEWGHGVHLEIAILDSQSISGSDPDYPGGVEMTISPNIVGNFLANTLPTLRVELDHADGTRTVTDLPGFGSGTHIKIRFKASEIDSQVGITVVASTPGTTGGATFVNPPSPSTSELDLWRSRGCTIGDHTTIKVGNAACSTQQVAGGDIPETRTIEMGRSSGSFVFQYDTYSIPDRIIVSYEGSVLFDTGCVGQADSRTLIYSGTSTAITVQVIPNCTGTTSTAWVYTVDCPQ